MNQALKIKIAGKEYILKQSFRGLMLFEEMTGKPVEQASSMKDTITLFYCILKGGNRDFVLSLDEFIDTVDEGGGVESFTNFMKGYPANNKKQR